MYDIEIYYQTGDSFHTEECRDRLNGKWLDINVVKENLKRIREHYEWLRSISGYSFNRLNKQQQKELFDKKPDFVDNNYDSVINLILDNGNNWQINTFWSGYFETLYSAEIVTIDDPEMKYVVGA